MGTISCQSNQKFYRTGTKTELFVPPTKNMKIFDLTASEEKTFKNAEDGRRRMDDGWTTDAGLISKL